MSGKGDGFDWPKSISNVGKSLVPSEEAPERQKFFLPL